MRVYGIFDVKAKEFQALYLSLNDDLICRQLRQMFGGQTLIGTYPEDFALYFLGDFETETGELKSRPASVVCQMTALIEKVEGSNASR